MSFFNSKEESVSQKYEHLTETATYYMYYLCDEKLPSKFPQKKRQKACP